MDERPATEMIHELREVGADAHHRLHLQDVEGKADAAAHTLARARDSGVPEALCIELASHVFQEIIEEIPGKSKERSWRPRFRSPKGPSALPKGSVQRQLPAGE
jgi:hypothetical protein